MSSLEEHSDFLKVILSQSDDDESEKFSERVRVRCEDALSSKGGSSIDDVITCAGDLINSFIQLNWTGPPAPAVVGEWLAALVGGSSLLSWRNKESLRELSWDGEPASPLLSSPLLLYTAHLLLEVCRGHLHGNTTPSSLFKLHRWRLRCLYLQQRVIGQRSASLWAEISDVVENLMRAVAQVELSKEKRCEVHLEFGHILLYYSMFERTKEHFARAQELADLTFDLTGALGKRTRFQQRDTAQLLLRVTSDLTGAGVDKITSTPPTLPKNLLLGDDTLLEHVQYSEPQLTNRLTPLQQAVLTGHCVLAQRSSPSHSLSTEEREAYINCVLSRPQCWSVECHALFLRCSIEKKRRRTVERAMAQLQELVDAHSRTTPTVSERLPLFYCTALPSHWTLQRELADALVSLGCLSDALELYERLEMWEELAECLQSVGRTGRAEEVLRRQIAMNATPTLWCLLGDVTKDPSHYTKAWELSNHRSTRAQRSLGLYHLRQERYEECIHSLQLALSINAMQENLWFSLGCAADKVGRTELALKAYQRCVTLDPDFSEAWNNLAGVHLKMNNKVRAYRVFKEALKCSYDNWKIWENLLVVSADVGAFDDSILAYHRLLDLRDKFIDVDVLRVLVRAVVEGIVDINDNSAERHRKAVGELLGRLTSQATAPADVWKLYADLHLSSKEPSDHDKALIELQKAQRMSKLEPGWDRQLDKLRRVVSFTMDYCQTCRRICSLRDVSRKKESLANLSSAKLALQGVLSKASEFGLVSLPEVEQLTSAMKEEREVLLTDMNQLNSSLS